jgi:ribosome-binding protein aMBF1 (putative translation factor)
MSKHSGNELRGPAFESVIASMLDYFTQLQLLAPSPEREEAARELADLVHLRDGEPVAFVQIKAARSLLSFQHQLEDTTLGTPEASALRRQSTPGQAAAAVSRSEQHRQPSSVAHQHAREQFAESLRLLREQAGLTVRELASHSGIAKSTVSDYLSGRSTPAREKLAVLLRACGVTDPAEIREWLRALDALAAPRESPSRLQR